MNTPAPPTSGTNRLRALLFLLLVFLLGAGCGIGGGLLVLHGIAQRAFSAEPGNTSPVELVTAALEKQIAGELELTPAQRETAHRELAITIVKFKDLRVRMRSDARAIVKDTLERVEQNLPPEKRVKLRERVRARLQPWGLVP